MIRYLIRKVAQKKGIANPYQLAQATELPYESCRRLWADDTSSMSKETLARLCATLNVQPADLIDWIPENRDLPPTKRHQRRRL
jgi:DNA-binding Xre family transcriptional regulator